MSSICDSSQTTATGNGVEVNFNFDFEYLLTTDVKVALLQNGAWVQQPFETYTVDGSSDPSKVIFDTAPPASSEANIKIYRETGLLELPATFFPGSAIRAQDLNDNFKTLQYSQQEIECIYRQLGIDNIDPDQVITNQEVQDGIISEGDWDDRSIATAGAIKNMWNVYSGSQPPGVYYAGKMWFQPAPVGSDQYLRIYDGSSWEIISTTVSGSTPFEPKEVIFVNNKGSDSNTGTSPQNAVATIKKALEIANKEQTKAAVNVSTATYNKTTGAVQVTTSTAHTLVQGNSVRLTPIKWECTVDGTAGEETYPKGTGADYVVQRVVDSTNFEIYVGPSAYEHTYKSAQGGTPTATPLDTYEGDGKIISVAAGIYAEELPLQMEAKNLSIIGNSLRNTYVHPAVPNDNTYDPFVPKDDSNELKVMFEMTSGSYITGLTLAGMKAKGATRNNPLDNDATYGLPTKQGWVAAFLGETANDEAPIITKSPYIQNCTNFADNSIDNRILSQTNYNNGTGFNPDFLGGEGGDITSAPTGGGILCNGDTPAKTSPLRSFVVDSFTQVALDGPGILCTNLGYAQLVSFFGTFCHYHAKARNGGILNLSNCTTDFGRYGLIADGRSDVIFTGKVKTKVDKGTGGDQQQIVKVGTAVYNSSEGSLEIEPATALTTAVSAGTLVKLQFLKFTKTGSPDKFIPDSYNREYAVISGDNTKFKITVGAQELTGYTYTANSGDLLVPTSGTNGPVPSTAITIDNLGDPSTDWAAPRTTTPGSTMIMRTGTGTGTDPYIYYPIESATAGSGGEFTVIVYSPLNNFNKSNLGFINDVPAGQTVSFYLQSYISTGGHTMEYVGSGCNYSSHPDYGGVPQEINQAVELGGETTPAALTPYNSGRIWLSSTDQDGKFKVGDTFSVNQKTGQIFIDPTVIVQPPLEVNDNLDVGPYSIYTSFGTNTNIQIAPKGTGSLIIGNTSTVTTGGTAPTNQSTNSIMGPLMERSIEVDDDDNIVQNKNFDVVTQEDIGYDADEVPVGTLLGQLAYTNTAPSVGVSETVPLPNEIKFSVNSSDELTISFTKPNGTTVTSAAITLS